jgi:hypothetical protein
MSEVFAIGVDVQVKRGIPVVVAAGDGEVVAAHWFDAATASADLAALVIRLGVPRCHVGIDAPRQPLPAPRRWSFVRGTWRRDQGKLGRHCEVAVKSLGLGNPQWTPLADAAPAWMQLGFDLFGAVEDAGAVTHEVFPSATYRAVVDAGIDQQLHVPIGAVHRGPKDLLDAAAAAYTVQRFLAGHGGEVGGGDGLGTIVLPVRPPEHPALTWPGDERS